MSEDALRIAVEDLFRFGLKWVEEGKLEPPLTMVLVAANGSVVAVRDSPGLPGKAEVVARYRHDGEKLAAPFVCFFVDSRAQSVSAEVSDMSPPIRTNLRLLKREASDVRTL